ncbi:MAG: CvpA family protein [Holosporales bacterium]|jgi:membrane protein required for colicin V production|nr:CvpA family protein [Holosporales bacterium]
MGKFAAARSVFGYGRALIHVPSDVPGFLRVQNLVTSGLAPQERQSEALYGVTIKVDGVRALRFGFAVFSHLANCANFNKIFTETFGYGYYVTVLDPRKADMNSVDLIIIGVMSIALIVGFSKGFIRELSSILAWVLAGIATFWDFPLLRTFMRAHFDTAFIADIIASVFVCVIAFTIVSFIGTVCAGFIRGTVISPVDRTFGAILGMAKYALVLGAIELVAHIFVPRASMPDQIIQSSFIRFIHYVSDCLQTALPNELQAFLHEFSGAKPVPDESAIIVDETEVKELGTLEPKSVTGAVGGGYTSDQNDQLNRILGSSEE